MSVEKGCSLESTVFETFKSLHYKKDKFQKAAMIYNEVEAGAAEQGPDDDKNVIYLNLDKTHEKKRRLYDLGEDGSSLLNAVARSSTCVGPSHSDVDELRRQVQDGKERTRQLEEEVAHMREFMAQNERTRQLEEEVEQIREFMAQMLAKDSQGDTSYNIHFRPPSSA